MAYKFDLTIAVITMNRQDQLIEALDSCLSCSLPPKVQFVVLNNASQDNTIEKLQEFKRLHPIIDVNIIDSDKNLGVGGGRSLAFQESEGEFVYFLDDDAVIDPNCSDTFFIDSLRILVENQDFASLTTNIYDIYCGDARNTAGLVHTKECAYPELLAWRGGSHFLRKSSHSNPLYWNIKYGKEELVPSILAYHHGLKNVYYDKVRIIHQPKENKVMDKQTSNRINIMAIAVKCATARMLYPGVCIPIIKLAFEARCFLHLRKIKGARKDAKRLVKELVSSNYCEQIGLNTVVKLYRTFGSQIF